MKNIEKVSLMFKCRDLLESGLTYEQIKYMLSYDKNLFVNKKAAKRLLDNKSDLSAETALELYQTEQTPTVISSLEEYGSFKEALDYAKDSMDYDQEQEYSLTLKNTNLD